MLLFGSCAEEKFDVSRIRSAWRHRFASSDSLLQEIGTDDRYVANLSAVDEFRVPDNVPPIAGTVTAQVAEE